MKRHEELEVQVAEAIYIKDFSFSDMKIFENVGGKALWVWLYENMNMKDY